MRSQETVFEGENRKQTQKAARQCVQYSFFYLVIFPSEKSRLLSGAMGFMVSELFLTL